MVRRTKEAAAITREQLLDAAERVFRERGVAGSSLAQIAAEAGVTRGAVYWHFRDANGRITFNGGEDFEDRHGAHRAIFGASFDVLRMMLGQQVGLSPAGILVRDFLDDGRHVDVRLYEVDGKVMAKDAA